MAAYLDPIPRLANPMLTTLLGLYLLALTPALTVGAWVYSHEEMERLTHSRPEAQATWAALAVPVSGALLLPWVILGCLIAGQDPPPTPRNSAHQA